VRNEGGTTLNALRPLDELGVEQAQGSANNDKYRYGFHTVLDLLKNHPEKISRLFLKKDKIDQRAQEIIDRAQENNISIEYWSNEKLNQLLPGENHQGMIAQVKKPTLSKTIDLETIVKERGANLLLLILDGIQDPHNLGACLRSSDAFSVDAVIIPKDQSVSLTPTVYKVASGAAENIPVITVTNLAQTLRYLKKNDIWIYGATEEGADNLYQIKFNNPTALVLGGEDRGLRRLTKEHCDVLFKIPMAGKVPSLNVSVATGICLFEVSKQRVGK
jgi:23S rRNA (guanosine2251-2'-O)-methyltransferase